MSAKAERVTHGIGDVAAFALAESVIEVEFFFAFDRVTRHMDKTIEYGLYADDRFDRARASEKVTCHGLRRVDGNGFGGGAEGILDRTSFVKIIKVRRSAVGVDIINVGGGHPGVLDGDLHSHARTASIR